MIHFHSPWYFLLLLVIPAAYYFLFRKKNYQYPYMRFSSTQLFKDLKYYHQPLVPHLQKLLLLLSLLLMIIALARPQIVSQNQPGKTSGIDIVLTLDLSTSMNALDFTPNNRLFVAKEVIKDFISRRYTDRIGFVVFAKEAYTQAPLTHDYNVLRSIIETLQTGILEDGTAIGNAIATSVNRLKSSVSKTKIIILLTDGDSNAGQITPKQAAQFAKDLNIIIFPILIGKGGKVPFPMGKDFFGQPLVQEVEMPINPDLLTEIAEMTQGKMFRATDSAALKENFHDIVNLLKKTELENTRSTNRYDDTFQYFIGLSLLLLLIERFLSFTSRSVLHIQRAKHV